MPERVAAVGKDVHEREGFDPGASTGLFVGVSTFEDSRFPAVPCAVDDAIDLAHLFSVELGLLRPERTVLAISGTPRKPESGRRLERLLELGAEQSTARQSEIYRGLGTQARASGPAGLFLLSVATHGISTQGGDYLIAEGSLRERMERTGVSLEEFLDEVGQAPALRKVVLLDACRERVSGETRGLATPPMAQSFADAIAKASGQVVLSGSTQGGYAYDDLTRGNGVFTGALLNGLRGAAPADARGLITVRSLADYLQERVEDWVRRNRPDHAKMSRGIGRRIEGPAESLPLAVNPQRAEGLERYRHRRRAALDHLKENLGGILAGSLFDQVLSLLPAEAPQPPALGKAEELLEEIEALDKGERSQRSLRDFVREVVGSATEPPQPHPSKAKKISGLGSRALFAGLTALALLALVEVWRLNFTGFEITDEEAFPLQIKEISFSSDSGGKEPETEGETVVSAPTSKPPPPSLAVEKDSPKAGTQVASGGKAAAPALGDPWDGPEESSLSSDGGGKEPETEGETVASAPTSRPPPPSLAIKKDSPKAETQVASGGKVAAPAPGDPWDGPSGIRFRFIPPGTTTLGSPKVEPGRFDWEQLPHHVTLTRGFWLAETEVTQGQWDRLVRENPSSFKACGEDCPVERVNWFEAVAFANRLSAKENLESCYELEDCHETMGKGEYSCKKVRFTGLDCPGYRLPTEAEWEVAARGGTGQGPIYTGGLTLRGQRDAPELDAIAWYCGNSGVDYKPAYDCSDWSETQYAAEHCGTHPVAGKKANPWGLHDMLGNVYEWTGDWHFTTPPVQKRDPSGPPEGSNRVIRGGSWVSDARYVRAAYRNNYPPSDRYHNLGFRLARGQVRSGGEAAEPQER